MFWTSFALVPMKRWIIVSPLSRKKRPHAAHKRCFLRYLMPCIRKPSVAAVLITFAVEERRHCLLQLGSAAVEVPSG
jgi:hypothetical protein